MPLIPSPRHTAPDLAHWRRLDAYDRRLAGSERLAARAAQAVDAIREFAAAGPCYVGASWGKDSVVVAHMARLADPAIPIVWVRVEPIENPDCALVRDAFLARFPGAYDEIVTHCSWDGAQWVRPETKHRHAAGAQTSGAGFEIAAGRYGDRYVSGVRGEESGGREMRMRSLGVSTTRTCAPIGWWSGVEVFAYLSRHDLPVHPAYAMTMGGALDRIRVRVASLGGERGTGRGRREWERAYYRSEMEAIARGPLEAAALAAAPTAEPTP